VNRVFKKQKILWRGSLWLPVIQHPKGVLVNCEGCGWDTRSKKGYCPRCSGSASHLNEQKGRSAISSTKLGGSAEIGTDGDLDHRGRPIW